MTKQKARKVSSARLATIAGKYLNLLEDDHIIYATDVFHKLFKIKGSEIRALAASVLSQTEPKRGKAKSAKGGR